MACDTVDTAFTDAFLDGSWAKDDNSDFGLGAIAEFNAASNPLPGDTVDPQLTFSNPSTPPTNNGGFAQDPSAVNSNLNDTLSPSPNVYENYSSMNIDASSTPYFNSIETTAPAYQPSPLRHEQHFMHRRSVSEPPADMGQNVFFTRSDHYLGEPIGQPKPRTLKSLPRSKSQRSQPYPPRQPTRNHPHPQALHSQPGFRPGVQRSQTQPVHAQQYAPTSSPMNHYPHAISPPCRTFMQQPPLANMMHEQQYTPATTTRVCTPVPEAVMASPPMIDPALSQASTPSRVDKRPQTVSIPVSLEELRKMIFDAVQQAIGEGKAQSSNKEDEMSEGVSPRQQRHVQMEEIEDEDAGVMKTV
ncbi:uncharacterized protein MYCFIDRAFT_81874 [Pseudocercospora fijiensis CIRAD86]|uniref:Uncharacterized protein n=1 Tax=Pseudocercospora fijiensis (strain CIRAD86) TaxID=383855 RepID=M2Z807_PSEFD|nr:uncharacterized protein MYCFIDRAFT_81874 [Pseudocercospora fijiensis CIRAD86]EME85905.1 hypothetical protein MYCFIDRAFT_81874 [Pseudocercospora fijiensis CIRAD86]